MRIHRVDLLHTYSRVVDAKFKTPKGKRERSAGCPIPTKMSGFCTESSVRLSASGVQKGFYLPENRPQERIIGP